MMIPDLKKRDVETVLATLQEQYECLVCYKQQSLLEQKEQSLYQRRRDEAQTKTSLTQRKNEKDSKQQFSEVIEASGHDINQESIHWSKVASILPKETQRNDALYATD